MSKWLGILMVGLWSLWSTGCIYDYGLADSYAEGEKAYISILINQDATSESRSDVTDLNHGDANEYTIKNAFLLLFENSSDNASAATFCGGFVVWDMTKESPTDKVDHISRQYKANVLLFDFKPVTGKYYYGLIVANTNDGFYATREAIYYYNEGGSYVSKSDFTVSDFMEYKMYLPQGQHPDGYFVNDSKNVFMTNALFYGQTGAAAKGKSPLERAVNVTDCITDQPSDGSNYAVFYIEHNVAKVQVKLTNGGTAKDFGASEQQYSMPVKITKKYSGDDVNVTSLNVSVEGWSLVNFNTDSYIMRKWQPTSADWPALKSNGSSNYRFLGTEEETTGTNYYRTYFCQSSHYDQGIAAYLGLIGSYQISSKTGPFWNAPWKEDDVLYCYENTFPVHLMMVKNATHVLVRANYGEKNDFFIVNGDKTVWYDRTKLEEMLVAEAKAYYSLDADPTVRLTVPSYGGNCTIESVSGIDDINSFKGRYSIQCYKDGKAYYLLPISHFGDDYTPWKSTETPAPSAFNESPALDDEVNINNSYPTTNRDDNYLGRWGVVRNCWYEMTITGVSAIGDSYNYQYYPEIIRDNNTPLDYYKTNLKVKLTVKPWILRDQSLVIITP